MTKRVLILCTGNSCRSQMAEVIWNSLSAKHQLGWKAVSAGSKPSGYVHPMSIVAMKEKGLPTEGLESKSSAPFVNEDFDLVVTVCGNAKDACPVWPGAKQLFHWPFEDPADATGTDREKQVCFNEIRDQIWAKIEGYLLRRAEFDDDTQADCLKLLAMALTEDTGSPTLAGAVDCTTQSVIPIAATASASFVSRAAGIICGVEIAKLAISTLAPDLELDCHVNDGDQVQPGDKIATFRGSAHQILTMERTCLNFMCRLSGISTLAARFTDQVKGTDVKVLDTRKTTPGYRRLEKYAVACGGGANHRMGLYDAIMIKDNHLAFYRAWNKESKDAIVEGLQLARDWVEGHKASLPNGSQTVIQLEVDTLEQFERALPSRPDIVLLDNMTNEQLTTAVNRRNEAAPGVLLEASGGVNLETIGAIAKTGVDRISIGALTHSAVNFDIGLDWTIGEA
jgi:nicotinate-nucleotide pyrophosphorylase (carboxylating)